MATKNKALPGYKEAHKNMRSMTEVELRQAIQAEVDKGDDARPDLLTRLVGRFNRVRGSRCMRDVLALMGKRGKHDVYSVLDGIR